MRSRLWYIWGKYYGYPECCINHLVQVCSKESFTGHNRTTKLTGTGYVTCPKCDKKNIKELTSTLKISRICNIDFPKCNVVIDIPHLYSVCKSNLDRKVLNKYYRGTYL